MSASEIVTQAGTIAANGGVVKLLTQGLAVTGLEIIGTWVGTLEVEVLIDGTTPGDAWIVDRLGAPISLPLTGNQRAFIISSGAVAIQVRASAWVSGIASVGMAATQGGGVPGVVAAAAVTLANGAFVTFGAEADASAAADNSTTTFMSLFKRLLARLTTLLPQNSGRLNVDGAGGTFPVTNASLTSLLSTQASADTIALASAARTTTQNIDITANNLSRMLLTIDVTAGSGGGITPAIKFKDPASAKFITLHAALTKITGVGTYTYAVGMGSPTAVGGVTAVIPFSLPTTARITLTVDDTTSYTYSVGYSALP